MKKRLLLNDLKKNKLLSISVFLFMAVSAALMGLTVMLFTSLLGSIDDLMTRADTCDFLQMHAGDLHEDKLTEFANSNEAVENMQICTFLNVENNVIFIGDASLSDSTQDNGFCMQSPEFDFLIDMNGEIANVPYGEVYAPICYKNEYGIEIGDTMKVEDFNLTVSGYIRDSQMNSMMASSKRFLVSDSQYEELLAIGDEEYLIEFKIKDGYSINEFSTAYTDAGLPANGPMITSTLIKAVNAMSDGMMILVILLVSIIVLLISIVCIRYIVLTGMEKDRREVGMMKAVGVSKKDIRGFYFTKYVFLSGLGAITGLIAAALASKPLGVQMRLLYGTSENHVLTIILTIVGTAITETIILLSVRRNLKKTEKISAVEALRGNSTVKRKKNGYIFITVIIAASVFLMLVPQNIASTMASEKFVTYMGIGNAQVRMDVRQSDDIAGESLNLLGKVSKDERVSKSVLMLTKSKRAILSDGSVVSILVEEGDHTVFPVSYIKGEAPIKEGEIALSSINASDLKLNVGDTFDIESEIGTSKYTVCGIYSDITNGGKTSKIAKDTSISVKDPDKIMWSILYVVLNDNEDIASWIDEYREITSEGGSVKIVDIKQYMNGTYGHTISRIKLASVVSVSSACIIVFIVVLLFVRLTIWQERSNNSLKKALGVADRYIKAAYMKRSIIYIAIGTVIGLILGITAGEGLAGILLSFLGASGFKFIIDPKMVFILIPLEALAASVLAVRLSLMEIGKIQAVEVSKGRD